PEAWRRRVAEADRGYARAAERLSQMLLEPAAAELGDKRLLVVAEGALQYVPFAALPAPEVAGAKRGGVSPSPLVAGHEVVMLPSASTVAVLRSESRARPTGKVPGAVAVIADPVFDADDPRLGRSHPRAREQAAQSSVLRDVVRAADEAGVRLERLRAAGDEADRIAALAPKSQVLRAVGLDANKARASGPELSRYRILHFATHALVNSQHPELSGIVLSLVDELGRPQDGFFRLHEIYNLAPRLGADLVVLSACQTALGREIKGEGLVGLTRGFMYAGAPRVVASLWRVDDQATAELMGLFYEGMLKRGLPAPRALKEAQVRMAARRPSPYYWAAFMLQGEWRP
ncbi:MAG TPA: CHAT domain-containing protein, partial [Pyrinomonadaceae bacterium]